MPNSFRLIRLVVAGSILLAVLALTPGGAPTPARAGAAEPRNRPEVQHYRYLPSLWRDPSVPEVCNSISPWWKATPGNPASYIFCAKQDLEFVAGWSSIVNFNKGDNKDLSLKWNIFGINGIWLRIDPSTFCGTPAGYQGTRNVAVSGSDGANNYIYPMNANEFGYGGFKIELYILNTQGETVGYNEKYLCSH